jgi:hypothetical protein
MYNRPLPSLRLKEFHSTRQFVSVPACAQTTAKPAFLVTLKTAAESYWKP